MKIKLIHATDESHVIFIARVSSNQENNDPGLLSYLIRQNHWSPFEMIGACVEINTTRDIGRQILRHRSFSFQEFSGRYASYETSDFKRDVRWKGSTNRQGSLVIESRAAVTESYRNDMREAANVCFRLYNEMLQDGVAAECARSILPEGFVPTKMYMNGTARSWIHYLRERMKLDPDGLPYAQREHYDLACDIYVELREKWPTLFTALERIDYIDRHPEDLA